MLNIDKNNKKLLEAGLKDISKMVVTLFSGKLISAEMGHPSRSYPRSGVGLAEAETDDIQGKAGPTSHKSIY